jgi:hypothetical protein
MDGTLDALGLDLGEEPFSVFFIPAVTGGDGRPLIRQAPADGGSNASGAPSDQGDPTGQLAGEPRGASLIHLN